MKRRVPTVRAAAALCAALSLAPLAAGAQMYRCVTDDGRKIYGEVIPSACVGQVVEQLNPQGIVIRRIEPPLTPEQRAEKAAQEQRRREAADAARIKARRDHALLATYTSLENIEQARGRALATVTAEMRKLEEDIGELKKREAELSKRVAALKGERKPPAKLAEELHQVELDLAAQAEVLAAKRKDAAAINARFDEEKKRFAELTTTQRH